MYYIFIFEHDSAEFADQVGVFNSSAVIFAYT